MGLKHEEAARLFRTGQFAQLIGQSGHNQTERRNLEPQLRAIVANAMALVGELENAKALARMDRETSRPSAVRSQAESTLASIEFRNGDIGLAIQHARAAVRFAHESSDPERIAWAQLHLLRLSIDVGPWDAIAAMLPDVRRVVARAGVPQVTAYLHNCVAMMEGQTGRLDEARR